MPSHPRLLRVTAAAVLATLAACSESGPVTPAADTAAPPPAGAVALACTATVATGSIECRSAGPAGARADLNLGGQGVRVRLTSSNVVYDGPTETLRADVTVQNLISQALGTPDGATKTGVRVFFHSGPTVTGGGGTVTVQNPDGTGTFTAGNQPYFLYDQILEPRGTSAAKTWRFNVPVGATTFVFGVYVAAQAPGETGVLRWTQEYGAATSNNQQTAVWGASDSSVFVVSSSTGFGSSPAVAHWNGHAWTELLVGESETTFTDVSGTSTSDVWVTGGNASLFHYDGNGWTQYPVSGGPWRSVWAASPTDAFAVGGSAIAVRWNGTSWSPMSVPNAPVLRSVWGSSASEVFAVGDGGRIVRYNGTVWQQMTSNTTTNLLDVWGSSPTDVWAVGGGSVFHYNGVSWTETATGAWALTDVWGSSATDVYALGTDPNFVPALLHWDGDEWSRVAPGPGATLNGIWGTPSGHFVAVGENGLLLTKQPAGSWEASPGILATDVRVGSASDVLVTATTGVLHWNGASWSTVPGTAGQGWKGAWYNGAGTFYVVGGAFQTPKVLTVAGGTVQSSASLSKYMNAVWGTGTTIFAVGDGGNIQRSTGGGAFSPMPTVTSNTLFDVWGSAADNVFAVGNSGTIVHFDGTSWSPMASGTTLYLGAVHGTSATDVWAVGGAGTVLHFNGSTWTPVPTGAYIDLHAVWVAPDGVVYVGGSGVLMRYKNGTWKHYAALTHGILGIEGRTANDVYAAGNVILHGMR